MAHCQIWGYIDCILQYSEAEEEDNAERAASEVGVEPI